MLGVGWPDRRQVAGDELDDLADSASKRNCVYARVKGGGGDAVSSARHRNPDKRR
jgi:hypothetical protein